ncbi:uncharacterized protein [Bemisia tabaci]|uniref:uncharacterized protein n=1 Tax=Bemisia tabaci TaxID=7038 RepID=UPI003B28728E
MTTLTWSSCSAPIASPPSRPRTRSSAPTPDSTPGATPRPKKAPAAPSTATQSAHREGTRWRCVRWVSELARLLRLRVDPAQRERADVRPGEPAAGVRDLLRRRRHPRGGGQRQHSWSQFQYATDVEVRIRSSDAAPLGPPANVVIRPSRIPYRIYSPRPDTILVCVPFDPAGRRFSVEFQNDLIRYRTDGVGYVEEGGVVVSEEPRNALLIFASPFIPPQLVPAKMDPDVQVLKPGKIVDGTIGTRCSKLSLASSPAQ